MRGDIERFSHAFAVETEALEPVVGTTVLEPRERADGREREELHARVFVGYLVDVDENT